MLCSRYIPIVAILFLAENMGRKKTIAINDGTLSTTNGTFISMLMIVILVVGALSFLPALALGPIADHFTLS